MRDEAALVSDAQERVRWHGVISDITDRKLAEAELERRAEVIRYQAAHDPLTSLPNRMLFQERLDQALLRPGDQVAVVMLDIDNFKLVNDSLGHSAGDELLMKIAPRLQTALRPDDTIARLGGDEFVVLLEQFPTSARRRAWPSGSSPASSFRSSSARASTSPRRASGSRSPARRAAGRRA